MRELKDIAVLVNIAQGGANRALFDRIATSGSGVERVDENTFKYSRPGHVGAWEVGGDRRADDRVPGGVGDEAPHLVQAKGRWIPMRRAL